jgi:chromate reductase
MSNHIRILGIAGSLRRGSYNQAALCQAKLLVPENSEIEIFQLDGIPMFNEDDEKHPPSSVLELSACKQTTPQLCFPDRIYFCGGFLGLIV